MFALEDIASHTIKNMERHLAEMRLDVEQLDDPIDAAFFRAHLDGMEQLMKLQKRRLTATGDEYVALTDQVKELSRKLDESLEVLKNTEGAVAPSV